MIWVLILLAVILAIFAFAVWELTYQSFRALQKVALLLGQLAQLEKRRVEVEEALAYTLAWVASSARALALDAVEKRARDEGLEAILKKYAYTIQQEDGKQSRN